MAAKVYASAPGAATADDTVFSMGMPKEVLAVVGDSKSPAITGGKAVLKPAKKAANLSVRMKVVAVTATTVAVGSGIGVGVALGSAAAPPAPPGVAPPPPPRPCPTWPGANSPITSYPASLVPGAADLPLSAVDDVLMLWQLDERVLGHTRRVPLARSYSGNPWEFRTTAAKDILGASALDACAAADSTCSVTLPSVLDCFGSYSLVQYTRGDAPSTPSVIASRFLAQATFGPTAAQINRLAGSEEGSGALSAASGDAAGEAVLLTSWMAEQRALAPTLLRAYYRERASPRPEPPMRVQPGGARGGCETGARYRRFALVSDDHTAALSYSGGVLYVDGEARTEMASAFDASTTAGRVCYVTERVGGVVYYAAGSGASCPTKASDIRKLPTMTNPQISFTTVPAGVTQVLSAGDASFTAHASPPDTLLLDAMSPSVACAIASVPFTKTAFMQLPNMTIVALTRQIALLQNSLAAPADLTTTIAAGITAGECPSVPKTFVNRESCVRRPSCAPPRYMPTPFTFNTTTLRLWHERSGHLLYYVSGLSLAEYASDKKYSPCWKGKSRWVRTSGACATETPLDASTKTTLTTALRTAASDPNPFVVRVDVKQRGGGGTCTYSADGVSSVGAKLTVDGVCWEHVHPDMYSVVDASYWNAQHDGNDRTRGYFPIVAIAERGSVELAFPASHPMTRWQQRRGRLPRIGVYGDELDFSTLDQDYQAYDVALALGAVDSDDGAHFEACGSPGEVANVPANGHRYRMLLFDSLPGARGIMADHGSREGKMAIWYNAVLSAQDQLRQRVAWALAQILVVGVDGSPGHQKQTVESWVTYYDIFVRHAFGSYRDVMREVAHSPLMGEYLTFRGNQAYATSNSSPDENFAREVMQRARDRILNRPSLPTAATDYYFCVYVLAVFSIGLLQLQDDGSVLADSSGAPLETYDNEDIQDFARVWTGYDRQPGRGNLEAADSNSAINMVDPMRVRSNRRDVLPKMDLHDRYVGDRYPLCSALPMRPSLRAGATFRFLGSSPIPEDFSDPDASAFAPLEPPRLTPRNTSALYAALCGEVVNGACTYPSTVTLSSNLPCDGNECEVDTARVVQMRTHDFEGLSSGDALLNSSVYFEYVRPPCVELAVVSGGKLVRRGKSQAVCAPPQLTAAVPACCQATGQQNTVRSACTYAGERTTYATATTYCAAKTDAYTLQCDWTGKSFKDTADCGYSTGSLAGWTATDCTLQVQVGARGSVNLVLGDDGAIKQYKLDNGNSFRVRWEDGAYPTVATDECFVADASEAAQSVCTKRDSTCVCSVTVTTSAVFKDAASVPTAADVVGSLFVGAHPPRMHDAGTYVQCTTAACDAQVQAGVTAYTLASSGGAFDEHTIFATRVNGTETYFANVQSTVAIGQSFSFRNPPAFLSAVEPTERDASYETEALIDHLFHHRNTAPFLAFRLIQRLVAATPSPRYVAAVTAAFRSGAYPGASYSGEYGDLGATIAAVLLDREAQTLVLDADPTAGSPREPMLKLIHVMRSLEFRTRDGTEVIFNDVSDQIGMAPFMSPSVFNFYEPEFQSSGAIEDGRLYAPEAQLSTLPYILGFTNGVASLVEYGLSSCHGGFGPSNKPTLIGEDPATTGRTCGKMNKDTGASRAYESDGHFTFVPSDTSSASAVVDELALLLTPGRLSPATRERLVAAYTRKGGITAGTAESPPYWPAAGSEGLKAATQMLLLSSEFHATAINHVGSTPRPTVAKVASRNRTYKAVVVLYLAGGCDSYNVLVPHSGCGGTDLYAEYAATRTSVALKKDTLRTISAGSKDQPCDTFGLHPALEYVQGAYNSGDAAFLANIGPLVEPLTADEFNDKSKRRPQSLFSHNDQVKETHKVDATDRYAKGVMGRLVDVLTTQEPAPYAAAAYSISGAKRILNGETSSADILHQRRGMSGLEAKSLDAAMQSDMSNMLVKQSDSIFAELHASGLMSAANKSSTVGALLQKQEVTADFPSTGLGQQMAMVSRVVKARLELQDERHFFYTSIGGFDTHSNLNETLQLKMSEIDGALEAFEAEMKAQGVWDSVVVVTVSDFGRTLHTNGQGTDHGWGGNHVVLGGGVRGGRILGEYPSSLTLGVSPVLVSRNARAVPTTSWESIWHAVSEWLGVDAERMETILPNKASFPTSKLWGKADVFE